MRIVADTNVVVSALLWGGTPEKILFAARARHIELYSSPALIAELEEIVGRQKFIKPLARTGSSAAQLVSDYLALVAMVAPTDIPKVVRDPDDDQVLACALAADADLIVSSDSDLLTLQEYQGIRIVNPTAAITLIGSHL